MKRGRSCRLHMCGNLLPQRVHLVPWTTGERMGGWLHCDPHGFLWDPPGSGVVSCRLVRFHPTLYKPFCSECALTDKGRTAPLD